MYYPSADAWQDAGHKRVLLFGMSGLGKTRLSTILRNTGDWFHYSIDYRIGTRYMGEHIADNFKAEAMKNPFLAELLRSDSVYIASNITFDNLSPLSTYLGKPGDPARGGLPFEEYMRRQALHREAEISSLHDTVPFVERAHWLYGCTSFICDSSGSICEVVDPWDDEDPVLKLLSENMQLVWIEGTEAHTAALIERARRSPKPMYYQPEFLHDAWESYLAEHGVSEDRVDPDDFVRSTFEKALKRRQPRYAEMARRWGCKISAETASTITDAAEFETAIARAIEAAARDRDDTTPSGRRGVG